MISKADYTVYTTLTERLLVSLCFTPCTVLSCDARGGSPEEHLSTPEHKESQRSFQERGN